MSQQMYRCVRVYNNGESTTETLEWGKMMAWLNYNRLFRPGVALFVDDSCKQTGYLSHDRCMDLLQGELKKSQPQPKDNRRRTVVQELS